MRIIRQVGYAAASRSAARRHAPACMNTPKTAEPLPVIRAPTALLSSMARMARSISGRIRRETGSSIAKAPRRAARTSPAASARCAASLSGLSLAADAVLVQRGENVLVDSPALKRHQIQRLFHLQRRRLSPTPCARCKPPRMQNGTSAPTVRPISSSLSAESPSPHRRFQPDKAPPPRRCCRRPCRPRRGYIFERDACPRVQPVAACSAAAAFSTRLCRPPERTRAPAPAQRRAAALPPSSSGRRA